MHQPLQGPHRGSSSASSLVSQHQCYTSTITFWPCIHTPRTGISNSTKTPVFSHNKTWWTTSYAQHNLLTNRTMNAMCHSNPHAGTCSCWRHSSSPLASRRRSWRQQQPRQQSGPRHSTPTGSRYGHNAHRPCWLPLRLLGKPVSLCCMTHGGWHCHGAEYAQALLCVHKISATAGLCDTNVSLSPACLHAPLRTSSASSRPSRCPRTCMRAGWSLCWLHMRRHEWLPR